MARFARICGLAALMLLCGAASAHAWVALVRLPQPLLGAGPGGLLSGGGGSDVLSCDGAGAGADHAIRHTQGGAAITTRNQRTAAGFQRFQQTQDNRIAVTGRKICDGHERSLPGRFLEHHQPGRDHFG